MNYELGIMRIWKKLFVFARPAVLRRLVFDFVMFIVVFLILNSLFLIQVYAIDPYQSSYQPGYDPINFGFNNTAPLYGSNNSPPRYGSNNTGRGGVRIDNPLAGIADDIPGLIGYVLNAARGIAALIAALMIVVGAYQILFSAGDPAGFKKGRQTIIYALIGLAVVLLANVLVSIIREIVGSV